MAKKRRAAAAGMGTGAVPKPTDAQGRTSVLIEFRQLPGASVSFAMGAARRFDTANFNLDEEFEPVRVPGFAAGAAAPGALGVQFGMAQGYEDTYVVRGTVSSASEIEKLQARPEVAAVWVDTPIAPFAKSKLREPQPDPQSGGMQAGCPIAPCDCDPGTPKGTIADVARYLGADRIWAAGFRGTGIVVGVVDSGITAQGRPVKTGETSRRISRVIGGWPTADWGTESSKWGDHGNMCATDVLGMAPDAQLYDLRVAGDGGSPGTISRALQAFNWAISQHRLNGTPQVLTNSWGIFQESWDNTYARNPNHPFTRKVVEAIGEGILVLFAAGNCGDTCPDNRCGSDVGSGRSIWGANGHPLVMTVGAVNRLEQFIGYSSRGPAALDPNKPDFCSVSHFTGYFTSDSGTSAATPILAGVVALLKQARPASTQDGLKNVLRATAKDIGPAGFDVHSGAGIVQGFAAFQRLTMPITLGPGCPPTHPAVCSVATIAPGCATQNPICNVTQNPACVPVTQPNVCPTLGPGCPSTQPPACVITAGPGCPRPTLTPQCPATSPPMCIPQTAPPICNVTLNPQCPQPTLACPRPTLGCFAGVGAGWGGGGWGGGGWASGGYPDPTGGYYGYGGEQWTGAVYPPGGTDPTGGGSGQ